MGFLEKWEKAPLVLFDFDGLLVDTERLHYRAYDQMLKEIAGPLDVDFQTYLGLSHDPSGKGLPNFIYQKYPGIQDEWQTLRKKKAPFYRALLATEEIPLMEGAVTLIEYLVKKGVHTAVVTNSTKDETDLIRKRLPDLDLIPLWITRENYEKPKPHPDGYLKALSLFPNINPSFVIGFEDSLKGAHSLAAANVFPILVCDPHHPQLSRLGDLTHISSLTECLSQKRSSS